jgi:hypothetical protein
MRHAALRLVVGALSLLVAARSGEGSSGLPWKGYICTVGDQGDQLSCAGWAVGYYAKSCMEAKQHGWAVCQADEQRFSPSWIYNQTNGGRDEGSSVEDAARLLNLCGAATLKTAPYDLTFAPTADAKAEAVNYRNASYQFHPVPLGVPAWTALVTTLKDKLQAGPVVFEVYVYPQFLNFKVQSNPQGKKKDENCDVNTNSMGWDPPVHAIACVDYDDARAGGSFLLVNSWGTGWGDAGFAWISYDVLRKIFRSACSFQDDTSTGPPAAAPGCSTFAPTRLPGPESADVTVSSASADLVVVNGPWIPVYPGLPVHPGAPGVAASVQGPPGGLLPVGGPELDASRTGSVRHRFKYQPKAKGNYVVTVAVKKGNSPFRSREVNVHVVE